MSVREGRLKIASSKTCAIFNFKPTAIKCCCASSVLFCFVLFFPLCDLEDNQQQHSY